MILCKYLSSKGGRPPTRKLSDRRAYKRQKHATMDVAADFLGNVAAM